MMRHRQTKRFLPLLTLLMTPHLGNCSTKKQGIQRKLEDTSPAFVLPNQFSGLQDCVDDLYASDLNDDLALSEEEYIFFIAILSDGAISVDRYTDLPLSLISNFVYGACFCSIITMSPNCCVGSEATIDLNLEDSQFIADNLITLCQTVEEAIQMEIGSSAPIATLAPTEPPAPTTSPTMVTPVEPSSPPTILPPSNSPTVEGSREPSASPTLSPTIVNSTEPSTSPSTTPAFIPTASPTNGTTSEPTSSPSSVAAPTLVPTATPTIATFAPSAEPSAVESPMPTPEALTCVNFQYGVKNTGGFSADDIFNEVNNTLKTGLLIATRNVTIEVLNATFPGNNGSVSSERLLRRADGAQEHHHRPSLTKSDVPRGSLIHDRHLAFRPYEVQGTIAHPSIPASHSFHIIDVGKFQMDGHRTKRNVDEDQGRRRTAFIPHRSSSEVDDGGRRRLVYFTDEYLPVINFVIDNPFCREPPEFSCAVVDSTVCVILEEGDDEEEVRTALLRGIEESILDGSFQAAIPPENQIPGDIE